MSGVFYVKDVKTGRFSNFKTKGKYWKSHKDDECWWLTSTMACEPHSVDGHTFEVCLHNVSRQHSSPTWPILAFTEEDEAVKWEKRLRVFAKTLDPLNAHEYRDAEINGDRRLGEWLTEQGFRRYNHVWWVRKA